VSSGQAIIDRVRDTIQDEDSTAYRIGDTKMLRHLNDGLKEMCLLRPDLFPTIGDITCTNGAVLHTAPAGAIILVDIFRVKNGRVVREAKREDLDAFNPDWPNDDADAAQHWMRNDKDPIQFFTYPKAPTGQVLLGQWAAPAADLTALTGSLPTRVSPAYDTALHHYVVFRCEAKDDEHVLSGRAKLYYDAFVALMGAGAATKRDAETPEGGRRAPTSTP